jgi:hypothetical protein
MNKISAVILTAAATWWLTPAIDPQLPDCRSPIYVSTLDLERVESWRQFSVWCWGMHWFTHDEPKGFWSTSIIFRPPRIQWSYLSHAWSDVLLDDRAWQYTPEAIEWKKQFEPIKEADDAKRFMFPNYWRR